MNVIFLCGSGQIPALFRFSPKLHKILRQAFENKKSSRRRPVNFLDKFCIIRYSYNVARGAFG